MREERENETFGCCCFKTGSLYQDMPVLPFEDQDLLNFLILADFQGWSFSSKTDESLLHFKLLTLHDFLVSALVLVSTVYKVLSC
jgi:hypothetical protein